MYHRRCGFERHRTKDFFMEDLKNYIVGPLDEVAQSNPPGATFEKPW